MKFLSSKILVLVGTLIFTTVVVFKFLTIQNLNVDDENFYLHHIEGSKLFSVTNDGKNTLVEVHDGKRVTLRGAYEKESTNVYRVMPYSFIDVGEGNRTATYRFLGDSSKKSFSYPVRFRKYEIIGGSRFGSNVPLVRLHSNDTPLLAMFPQKGKVVFGKTNEGIRIVALQEGLTYIDKKGKIVDLAHFTGSKNALEKALKDGILPMHDISADGVIGFKDSNETLVLNLSIEDGIVSKKMKDGSHRAVKTKYITIKEYSDFENISKLVLSDASAGLYVNKEQWQQLGMKAADTTYLDMPYEIPIDEKIVVKGRDSLFGFSKYGMNADFAKRVPRLDKPKVAKAKTEKRNSRYVDFLDIDNMYGLYVSDSDASIFYSRDKKRWIKAVKNYKYTPPLYLYDAKVTGQFVAPKSFKDEEGVLYYKVVSPSGKFDIAFHGKVKVLGKNGTVIVEKETTHKKRITVAHKEVIIEAKKMPLPRCGELFSSKEKLSLTYAYRDGYKREFRVEKEAEMYVYYIKEKLDPFKVHTVNVKGVKNFKFEPQLSCKYRVKPSKEDIPSLYTKDNYLQLIPKEISRVAKKTRIKQDVNGTSTKQKGVVQIPKELIPIYGDGQRFGLLSHGVEMDDLTMDKDFSLKVAKIFEKAVKPLHENKRLKKLLQKYQGEMIEGATVVLKVNKDTGNKEILALFSYPYPQSNETQKQLIVDTMNNRVSTIKNRAFDMLTHPGSTFKIVTAIALAQEGKLNDFKALKGLRNLKGAKFSDGVIDFKLKNYSQTGGLGHTTNATNFIDSFAKSYNTYFGYAGLTLHKRLSKHYSKFLYPIVLNEEERKAEFILGTVAEQLNFNAPIVLDKEHHIYARASLFPTTFVSAKEVADTAIGQYEVYTTPLQMAIVGSVVYDNKLQIPMILKDQENDVEAEDIIDKKEKTVADRFGSLFGGEEGIEQIQTAMAKVVTSGTAHTAFKRFKVDKKVKVYGKTGTSQKGKLNLYDGSFVCYTKGLKEDLIIATVVRNSGTGGKYAAPISRDIIKAWIAKTEPELLKRKKSKKRKIK